MIETIRKILAHQNILSHTNQGILIASVASSYDGVVLAQRILDAVVDRKTVVYLSGGKTPKSLYESLASDEAFVPAVVAQVDERYGAPMHPHSNEKMIKETGFLEKLQFADIPFYPMLQQGKTREEVAELYDQHVRSFFSIYQKSVGILGIGVDGHTAGIPSQNAKFKIQNAKLNDEYNLVDAYNDPLGIHKERVSMTFLGLSMFDVLLVLVFGADKREALQHMFEEGPREEIPARFYTERDIAKKTLIITDQMV